MSKHINIKHIAAITVIALMVLSGCGLTVRHNPGQMHHKQGPDHRRAYEMKMERNERRIANLRNSQHKEDIYVIEVRHGKMKQQLNNFKGSTKKEWKSFKREFNHDMKGVDKSLKDITKRNKKR